MKYYMTIESQNSFNAWHLCNAKTLIGAKREASKEMDWGYAGDAIIVAKDDGIQRYYVARKRGDKWETYDYI